MPIPWITLLSQVPWKQVIEHAPAAVEGAGKLWRKVRKPTTTSAEAPPLPEDEPPTLETLHQRLARLEANSEETARQMLDASELLQTLAEQNAQLIARLEEQRMRQRRLFYLAASALMLALSALFAVLIR